MVRFLSLAIALLAVLVLPGAAVAQDAKAPPGLSAADEYLETVPRADGNASVGNGQRPNPEDPAVTAATEAALPPRVRRALADQGEDGEAAAALAGRTAPPPATSGPAGPLLPEAGSPDPLAAIGRIATGGTGDDGIGILFPLLLIAGTLAVAGSALARRRAASP